MPVKKNTVPSQLPLNPVYKWRQGAEGHPLKKEMIKN